LIDKTNVIAVLMTMLVVVDYFVVISRITRHLTVTSLLSSSRHSTATGDQVDHSGQSVRVPVLHVESAPMLCVTCLQWSK